ncbi:hypothetical protein PV325_009039 [Microctonus aethiopoides]|nr:hypothetical protein PV325_009039 [Microctonus aethiopoides]
MPNELHSRDVTYKQSSSPSSLSVLTSPELSSGSSLLSIETTLNVFINQQTLFNKDLSDAITSIKLQSKNQQDMNIKLNASMKQQIKGQEEITTKLNEIKNLTKTLADHEVRIKKLEQQNNLLSNELSEVLDQNELLAREIEELKVTLSGISSESILSEIIISAIPIQLSDDLQHVVSRVLTSLDSSQLLSDVLDIRKVAPKNDTRTASTSSTAQSTKTSVIVRFKSANIARFLIEKKRRKGSLTLKHVFDSDIRGKVYVNEFLSTKVHNLYRKTKEIVISRKWKYVWATYLRDMASSLSLQLLGIMPTHHTATSDSLLDVFLVDDLNKVTNYIESDSLFIAGHDLITLNYKFKLPIPASRQVQKPNFRDLDVSVFNNIVSNDLIDLHDIMSSLTTCELDQMVVYVQRVIRNALEVVAPVQQSLFNNNLSDLLSKQAVTLNDQTMKLNEQNAKLNLQNEKLNEIKNIAKSVAEHQVQIIKLEKQNELLSKQMSELIDQNKRLIDEVLQFKNVSKSSPNLSSEVIITGLPDQLAGEPQAIVNKVLASLDLSKLASDVLDIRRINKKHDSSSTTSEDRKSKWSLIVKFKSQQLSKHTKDHAKLNKWKYVWTMDGQIYARKDDGLDKVTIATESDLQLLTSF